MSETVKKALISILVGAGASFLTVILQGLIGLLTSWPIDGTAGAVATLYYFARRPLG